MDDVTRLGIVLFAHGARDPHWALPFERLRDRVAALMPESCVALGFLEVMTPDLEHAVDGLRAQGCSQVRVVPVFLGEGGHVREDLPRLIEAARLRHPGLPIDLARAVGEVDAVLDAIARYAAQV